MPDIPKVSVINDRTGMPKRVHYSSSHNRYQTLCGIDLVAINATHRRFIQKQDYDVPMCRRCSSSYNSRRTKFEKYQKKRQTKRGF